jgi:mRNA interferase MazF
MVIDFFIPSRGDVVWLSFNPQSGHEQAGRRPALVISPKKYNEKTGLSIFCPITSQIKDYPFEVRIEKNKDIKGVILSDQIKSLDWRARKAEFICKLDKTTISQVLKRVSLLIL